MSRVTSHPPRGPAATAEANDASRGSAIKLAAEILSRLMTLGTTVLIGRELGAAGFGAFGRLWILAPLVAEAAEFGLQATATRALVAGTFSWRSLVAQAACSSPLARLLRSDRLPEDSQVRCQGRRR